MMRYAEEKKFLKKRDYTSIKGEPSKKFRKEYHSLPILSEIKARIKKKGDLYTCFLLGTQAGLRKGEITYLEKADYRPDLHAVTIRPKKYWQPKTAASERTVRQHKTRAGGKQIYNKLRPSAQKTGVLRIYIRTLQELY